jgi:hypothetical protein
MVAVTAAHEPNRPFRAAGRPKIGFGKPPDLNELGDTDPRSLSDLQLCFSLQTFSNACHPQGPYVKQRYGRRRATTLCRRGCSSNANICRRLAINGGAADSDLP